MSNGAHAQRIGWIGAGRMGSAMVGRLLEAGYDVTVWNRTRAKCEPLEQLGASVAQAPAELAPAQSSGDTVLADARTSAFVPRP